MFESFIIAGWVHLEAGARRSPVGDPAPCRSSMNVYHSTWYGSAMDDRLTKLLDLLDQADDETVGTSVRLPANLRAAAALATQMGMVVSVTDLTVQGIRDTLEAFAQRAVLEAHYQEYPEARPTLAQVALAGAELDGNPLAEKPDLVHRAAAEIVEIKPAASPDDVLVYAAGLASGAA